MGRTLDEILTATGWHDVGASVSETKRDSFPDAGSRANDDGNTVREIESGGSHWGYNSTMLATARKHKRSPLVGSISRS